MMYRNGGTFFAKIFPCILIASIFFLSSAYGHGSGPDEVGIQERLGQSIPLDLMFNDEQGSEVKLQDLINKPTILVLLYYSCEHICPQMLFGLSEVLSKLDLTPGRDYQVIALSFDDTDTPEAAQNLKRNYIKAIDKPFPQDAWKFLTGDRENIEKISRATGINYKKVMHGFIHPEVLIFLSPQGRITRYLHVSKFSYGVSYPMTFSAVDFVGALTDASKGTIGESIKKTPLICFPHEPELQERFFRVLAISGAVTLLSVIGLFIYLRVTSKKFPGGTK
jgi:protein SCO1/2